MANTPNYCEECDGTGEIDCPECDGYGCDACEETGTVPCATCDGTGEIESDDEDELEEG